MKHITIFAILIGIFIFFVGFLTKPLPKVKGKILHTADYCGGAAPSEEIIKNLATEKPLANTQLFLKAGNSDLRDKPILQTLTTDANGNFELSVAAGTYSLVVREKTQDFSKGIMAKFGNTPECISWQNSPNIVIVVKKSSKKAITYKTHIDCNKCLPPRP